MKNKIKVAKIIYVVVCLVVSSVSIYSIYTNIQTRIDDWKSTTWFMFSKSDEGLSDEEFVDVEEFEGYQSTTDIYNSGVYYSALNEREQLVYKAFQYALDNNYCTVYIDDAILQEGDLSESDILKILSLDSATVQQNIKTTRSKSSHTISSKIMGITVEREISGTLISTAILSEEHMGKVKEAIAELEKVDFDFTEKTTQTEKAQAIFEYVEENVAYDENWEAKKAAKKAAEKKNPGKSTMPDSYVYLAVFEGKTICDGYANMYSLLCHMNGLECFEKTNAPETEDGATHTWDCVKVDGKWYNVDATESINDSGDTGRRREIKLASRFGLDDELQPNAHIYAKYVPECKNNLSRIDKKYPSSSGSGMGAEIASYIRNSENEMAVIAIRDYDKDVLYETLQDVADSLHCTIKSTRIAREEYDIVCVYKK